MKMNRLLARTGRLTLSTILAIGLQTPVAQAKRTRTFQQSANSDTGLFPIGRANSNGGSDIGNLFPIDSPNNGNDNGNNNGGNNNGGWGNGNGNGNNNGGWGNGNNNGGNNNGNRRRNDGQYMTRADVDEEFRCNIFENTPYQTIISAVNSLNQAVNSLNCGNSKIDVSAIVENNKKIVEVVTNLRGMVENPETVVPENSTDVAINVDQAIRAANGVATAFAQSDLLNEQCRNQMNFGQVATSIGDILNGLTPYALLAAQMSGGTAAIPFIVGGAVVTSAIGSMNKIIEENTTKVSDPQVRRAIVENTCQFIRLDQKYKFLIKSRAEQLQKITEEISTSQSLFSSQLKGMSPETQNIMNRKKFLDQMSVTMRDAIGVAQTQLELDKQFLKTTSDDIKICQLGIQLAVMAKNPKSYVSSLLGSLNSALAAYGTTSVPQAQALKTSADFAIKSLQSINQKQYSINSDFKACNRITQSFVETIDKAGTLSKHLVKMAQADLDKQINKTGDSGLLTQQLQNLSSKQVQAERVAGSLENLRNSATKITQSEIDAEMDRLRRGLLAPRFLGIPSPVSAWFNYVRGLHQGDVTKFHQGLESLRARAYNMTDSGKAEKKRTIFGKGPDPKQVSKDKEDALQLRPFNLKSLPLGTREHDDACREMQDVWNRWVIAVDHLGALDSFCGMIEPYIYDNRQEDRDLVKMCRGYSEASGGDLGASVSVVGGLKNKLVTSRARDWALYLDKVIQSMVCVDAASEEFN